VFNIDYDKPIVLKQFLECVKNNVSNNNFIIPNSRESLHHRTKKLHFQRQLNI